MSKTLLKICFLADRHSLFDDRIYWKEALSLKKNGFEVHYLLVGDSEKSGTTSEGIYYQQIRQRTFHKNRLLNFLIKKITPRGFYDKMFKKAAAIHADAYHIHDLRVNRIGKKLKQLPHKPFVVYDVHEPYPENVIDYYSGPDSLKPFVRQYSAYIRRWERKCARQYDLIITTEENMHKRFKSYFPGKPVEIIYNYTSLPPLKHSEKNQKIYDAIYTGGITRRRGAFKILEALKIVTAENPGFQMLFLGSWFPASLKSEMKDYVELNDLGNNVIFHEAVPFNEVSDFYRKSRIGLGIFLPVPTHRIILQIKIFEYMNFGLPIVGSNFGHLKEIIDRHHCGLTVDPEDPGSIASAIKKLLNDYDLYKQLSQNGMEAAQQNYRWEQMEKKLVKIYRDLLKDNSSD